MANEQRRFGEAGHEVVRDSVGELTDTRFERALNEFDRPSISGSYSHITENGSAFNLVAELNGSYSDRGERSERLAGDPAENVRVLSSSEDEHNYEIGVDYEFNLGEGRLKFIGLHRFESSPTSDHHHNLCEWSGRGNGVCSPSRRGRVYFQNRALSPCLGQSVAMVVRGDGELPQSRLEA